MHIDYLSIKEYGTIGHRYKYCLTDVLPNHIRQYSSHETVSTYIYILTCLHTYIHLYIYSYIYVVSYDIFCITTKHIWIETNQIVINQTNLFKFTDDIGAFICVTYVFNKYQILHMCTMNYVQVHRTSAVL